MKKKRYVAPPNITRRHPAVKNHGPKHDALHGERGTSRRKRQIANGQLKRENGLAF